MILAGVALSLWGLIGLWAASIPADDAETAASFGWSGAIELALGLSLIVVGWFVGRRARAI